MHYLLKKPGRKGDSLKYIVIVGDGMADNPVKELGNKTPLEYAKTPNFDRLATEGEMGLLKTIPESLPPGSDTANLSLFGYDPLTYYTGRSPLEAISLGIDLGPDDVSFRCNFVTLSDEELYESKKMLDYCAGEISTEEASDLLVVINDVFSKENISFHTGFYYRHVMVWNGAPLEWQLTPPHDISGKGIRDYLPGGKNGDKLKQMMIESYNLLENHPVNIKRREKGLSPANSIWIWGNGKKPSLPLFEEKYGLKGSVISAVDLIKGLGIFAGLEVIHVEGATGYIDTNLKGKVEAALDALSGDKDFVYLHIEAPDECSHRFETQRKVEAIEMIDKQVVKVISDALENADFDYGILLATDHATPLSSGTHTRDPVPFSIYRSDYKQGSKKANKFSEAAASETGLYLDKGYQLMDRFILQKK